MTHGSLFSGIGGFDLAAHWAGIPTLWQVEKDDYCRAVLRKHFPEAKQYEDIKNVGKELEPVSIISGGFPCQPFSVAGKQRGKADDRYLWPEMLRVIAEVRPTWVIAENVAGIIRMELDSVLASLEAEGYTAWPLIIPACGIGARHRRNRVWIISTLSDSTSNRRIGRSNHFGSGHIQKHQEWDAAKNKSERERRLNGTCSTSSITSDTAIRRLPDWCGGKVEQPKPITEFERPDGSIGTTAERRDKTYREIERDFRRVAHGVSRRVDRLKALGNAIVPQIAYQIFKAIKEVNS